MIDGSEDDSRNVHESSDSVRSLIGSGSIYAAGKAVQLSAAVLVLPVLTRLLTPGEYGEIATALVVIQLLTFLAAGGLPVAITLEFFRGEDGPHRARGLVLWTALVGSIVTLTAQLLAPYWIRIFGTAEHLPAIRVAVLATMPLVVLTAVQSLLQVRRQPKQYAVVTLAGTAGAQVIGLLFVLFLDAHASTYLAGMALGGAIAAGAGLLLTGVDRRAWRNWRLPYAGLMVGLPTVPHDVSIYIILAGDRVILERSHSFATVGRYQIAYIAGTLGISLMSALNSAWLPIIYGAADQVRWKLLADMTVNLYWLAALVTGTLSLAAPLMLSMLAADSFKPLELAPMASMVALSVLPYVTVAANVLVLLHLGKSAYLAWATPLCAAFNIGLNIVFVPRYGMTASAVLTVVTYCFQAMVLKLLTRRLVTIPWRKGAATTPWLVGMTLAALGIVVPTTIVWLVLRGAISAVLLAGVTAIVLRRFRRAVTPGVA